MKIVVDTNIFVRERFDLSSNPFVILAKESEARRLEIEMPQIVFDEVLTKFREGIEDERIKATAALSNLASLRAIDSDAAELTLDAPTAVKDFEFRLRSWLREARARVSPYPTVGHEAVAQRALLRRKPFDGKGRAGYRDALIWESILRVLAEDDVSLVSRNYKDFAVAGPEKGKEDSELTLHPQLAEEAKQASSSCHVRLFFSFRGLLDALVPADSQLRHEVTHVLENDPEIYAQLHDLLPDSFEPYVDLPSEELSLGMGVDFEIPPRLVSIYDLGEYGISRVNPLGDDRVAFDLETRVEAEIDFDIFKMDYATLPRRVARDVHVSDLNKHFFSASTSHLLDATFEGVYNRRSKRVEKLRFVSAVVP